MWTTLFNHLRQTTELVLASMTSLRLYQCVRISMTSMTAQLLKVQEMLPGPQKTYAGHRPRGERPPAHKTLVLTCVLLSLAIGSLHSPLQPLQLSHMSQPLEVKRTPAVVLSRTGSCSLGAPHGMIVVATLQWSPLLLPFIFRFCFPVATLHVMC